MTPAELAAEKYVSITTFRRDGTSRSVPVWIAPLDGDRAGFTTERDSHKVRRLEHDPRVRLQPCNGRGRVDADHAPLDARARVASDDEAAAVRAAILGKYGWQLRCFEFFGTLGEKLGRSRGERCAIVIDFD